MKTKELEKVDKKKLQTRQQVFHNIMEVVELFPDKNTSQHIVLLFRSRGGKAPYDWTEEELLKNVEKYKEELESDFEDEFYEDQID